MNISGGEAVVKSFVEHNVGAIYGLPGSGVLDIYKYLRDEKSINHILAMHEVNAAFMADAHGRLTGKPGVCVVKGGPGATNAVTGIAQAYTEASPVVLITGSSGIPSAMPDRSEDADFLLKIYHPLTKWSTRIEKTEDIPMVLDKALTLATSGRPGPVHLEMPKDVLASSRKIPSFIASSRTQASETVPSLEKVVETLKSASNPLIAVGKGVLREFCSYEVIELARSLSAPVLTLPSAISAIPFECPLYVGYDLPQLGRRYTRWKVHPLIDSLVKEADVVLTLGLDLGERLEYSREKRKFFIHVHRDISTTKTGEGAVSHLNRMIEVKTSIKCFVESLEREVRDKHTKIEVVEKRISKIKQGIHEDIAKSIKWGNNPLHPGEISTELSHVIDDDAIVTLDVGNSAPWMKICHRTNKPNTILAPGSYDSMGFALPAAIAAKINFPDRQVVAVVGDGSFLMSYMDFPTLIKYGLEIVVIVESNQRYGMIWQMQRTRYSGQTFATEIRIPDFVEYAHAFGVVGLQVKDPSNLKSVLEEAVNLKGPVLVDIATSYRFPSYVPTRTRRMLRKMTRLFGAPG